MVSYIMHQNCFQWSSWKPLKSSWNYSLKTKTKNEINEVWPLITSMQICTYIIEVSNVWILRKAESSFVSKRIQNRGHKTVLACDNLTINRQGRQLSIDRFTQAFSQLVILLHPLQQSWFLTRFRNMGFSCLHRQKTIWHVFSHPWRHCIGWGQTIPENSILLESEGYQTLRE